MTNQDGEGATMPSRIVYRRGELKPAGVVIVTRVSRWGNPYRVDEYGREEAVRRHREDLLAGRLATRAGRRLTVADVRRELRGKTLGCSCELDELCHADTLIEIANDRTQP
jgi:hypothetical protein